MEKLSQTQQSVLMPEESKEAASREERILTCIGCPMGCAITVELADGQVAAITGSTCRRATTMPEKRSQTPPESLPPRSVSSAVKRIWCP